MSGEEHKQGEIRKKYFRKQTYNGSGVAWGQRNDESGPGKSSKENQMKRGGNSFSMSNGPLDISWTNCDFSFTAAGRPDGLQLCFFDVQ